MNVVEGIDALDPSLGRLFVVVGVFDGLHRGHAYLLGRLGAAASAWSAAPTVITFDHHPDEVIIGAAPPLLCDPEERLERLAQAGVAVTVVQTFDVALRMTPFDTFVRRIASRVELAGFLMTPESAFGHDRGGTPETVAALGRELGYDVAVVPQFELDGRPVRSTDVRTAIAAGDLALAARLLGHPYGVVGRPGSGADGRARLDLPMPVALPPAGTYRVAIGLDPSSSAGQPHGWATITADRAIVVDGPRPAGTRDRLRIEFVVPGAGTISS
jgi:riboflavin kinase / FMN adenylyltransferase